MTRFGVNYTPARGWFHSWLDFRTDDAHRDLEAVASLGVDHIRIFPLWPLVQPNRGLIRERALADVVALVDVAAAHGLEVNVDLLQGHLSSFDFLPSWLESWHRRNMFTDPDVIASTAEYVRTAAAAVAERPNLLGVTLGNELNQFAAPPHPTPHAVDPHAARGWLETMVSAAREGLAAAPGAPLVTHALYDAGWYDDAQPFGPAHAAEVGDATITHSWVFNGAAQRAGGLGAGSVRHAQYLLQLAAAFNPDPARPNWLQEVGAPTNVVAPGDAPAFVEATVRGAAAVPSLFGVTWWCSHDVSRSLLDFPDLEYDLGLFTADGDLKPVGRRLAEVIRELRDAPAPVPSPTALVLEDAPLTRSACAPGGAFAAEWLRMAEEEGDAPQIILASRVGRAEQNDRGIVTVRTPPSAAGAPLPVSHPATTA